MSRALVRGGAARVIASTYGTLVGVSGIEHGLFEVLQGNARPDGVMIDAIGPAQRLWEHGSERALTIVPNFLATGILAIILGVAVVVWSVGMVHRRHGASILLVLCIVLFLVGGGFAPILVSLLAVIAATRIGKPLRWWRTRIPHGLRSVLSMLYPWSLGAFVLAFVTGVEIAIFGDPLASWFGPDAAMSAQNGLAYAMLGLMLLSLPCGFSRDAAETSESV